MNNCIPLYQRINRLSDRPIFKSDTYTFFFVERNDNIRIRLEHKDIPDISSNL